MKSDRIGLVLYSDQMHPETAAVDGRLLDLIGRDRPRIGYIPSCSDPGRRYFQERQEYYSRLGITLSTYFELDEDYQPETLDVLLSCDAIHLSGGNTFYFLRWLRARGMVSILQNYARRGGVLVGVSAGSILMTPDVSTSLLCGDTRPEGMTNDAGMGLVDFGFVPHYGDDAWITDIEAYSRHHQAVVYACRDGGGIIVDGDRIECVGEVKIVDARLGPK